MTMRDAQGGTGSTVTWYSYNLPKRIGLGSNYSDFSYTPARSRWKQVANYGGNLETTLYIGGLLEIVTHSGVTEYRHQIPAGGSAMILYTRRSDATQSTYYVTRDHLGSSTTVMDNTGTALVNLSFAAYGGRRKGTGWNDDVPTNDWTEISATTRRGFTGHEELDNIGAIHMNGRAYDPGLGRFLSADPVYVGDLTNPQSLNPYSYVGNNPLNATDPTGFCLKGRVCIPVNGSNHIDEMTEIIVEARRLRDPWVETFDGVRGDSSGHYGGGGGEGGGGGSGDKDKPTEEITVQVHRKQQQKPPPVPVVVLPTYSSNAENGLPEGPDGGDRPEGPCPNGGAPARSNNPDLLRNTGRGALAGYSVGPLVIVVLFVAGSPESEVVAGSAGLLRILAIAAEVGGHSTYAGIYGGLIGGAAGATLTQPTCPQAGP